MKVPRRFGLRKGLVRFAAGLRPAAMKKRKKIQGEQDVF